jgi:hypothetical protein
MYTRKFLKILEEMSIYRQNKEQIEEGIQNKFKFLSLMKLIFSKLLLFYYLSTTCSKVT